MRMLCRAAAAMLVCAPAAWALPQDAAKKDAPLKKPAPADAKAALQAIQEALQALSEELGSKFQAAKTPDEKNAIRDQFMKVRATFAPKFLAVAEKYPKEAASFEAAILVIMFGRDEKEAGKAIDILIAHHLEDQRLGQYLSGLTSAEGPAVEKLFKMIVEKSTKKEIQGQAALALAQNLRARAEKAQSEKKPNADQLSADAEKQYEQVVQKYKDVADVVDSARSELFELKHLSLGRVAPETEGEDSDGKKFKLSDYRGKVVVIDFWAGW